MNTANNKRYFIVFFDGKTDNGSVTGEITFTSSVFLNRKLVGEQIKDKNKGVLNVVLTGILELTKIDYENYIKEL